MIQWMLTIWSLVPLPFLSPLEHLEAHGSHTIETSHIVGNFEHYFASVWDEHNCVVVWAFFGIAFLWGWNENWPFPVLWPLLSFPNLLAYWVQHFHRYSSRIWKSSTGIPSPLLALFVVILPNATWLHIPGYLALGEWSHHCGYLGHKDVFCIWQQYLRQEKQNS